MLFAKVCFCHKIWLSTCLTGRDISESVHNSSQWMAAIMHPQSSLLCKTSSRRCHNVNLAVTSNDVRLSSTQNKSGIFYVWNYTKMIKKHPYENGTMIQHYFTLMNAHWQYNQVYTVQSQCLITKYQTTSAWHAPRQISFHHHPLHRSQWVTSLFDLDFRWANSLSESTV